MPLNSQLESPTIRVFSFDELLAGRTLRGIDVLAAGTLFVEDIEGNTTSYPFTSVSSPIRLALQIRKVIGNGSGSVGNGSTGTDIPLASLRGLH